MIRPVVFATGKPHPWWRNAESISLIVSALAATGLGLLSYASSGSGIATNRVAASSTTSPDAVIRTLSAGKPTIIEFGANNCVSCREMKPVLRALAQDTRIAVADIDILKERDYISRFQIRLMPTQVFYDASGKEIGRHMGKISSEEVLSRLGVSPLKAAL